MAAVLPHWSYGAEILKVRQTLRLVAEELEMKILFGGTDGY